ncbi:MAG: hypothetical protein ABIP51_08285 [Bacteroidia bacterium]
MQNQLFIPSKIKVGYNERDDTYTKRLAYVIYYDSKGILRKEQSFKSWIDKGVLPGETKWNSITRQHEPKEPRDPLPIHDFDNVPTDGFVLNKKAGGYATGWDHRATYCRVYDPRGFEFEISIENLLFILQECTSSKGKGLEGEFVYSWFGKDLVLIPTSCEEYIKSTEFTSLKTQKVASKTLIEGAVYQTKSQEKIIYLGKFPWWFFKDFKDEGRQRYGPIRSEMEMKNYHFFRKQNKEESLIILNSLISLANCISDSQVSNYAELMAEFAKEKYLSKPIKLFTVNTEIPLKEKEEDGHVWNNYSNYYLEVNNSFVRYSIRENRKWENGVIKISDWSLNPTSIITFNKEDTIKISYEGLEKYSFCDVPDSRWYNYSSKEKYLTKEEIKKLNFKELFVTLENGTEINFNDYKR